MHHVPSSPSHRIVALQAQHGITPGPDPHGEQQHAPGAGFRVSTGSCPIYVTRGRGSAAGSHAPVRLALMPKRDRHTRVLTPDGRPWATYVELPPVSRYDFSRPEPRHPAVRLLGLVLVLACLVLLWQFGQLLERDGAFTSSTVGSSEVAR